MTDWKLTDCKLPSIKSVLISRDGMTPAEAEGLIEEAKAELKALLSDDPSAIDSMEFMKDWFSLEPDYIIELLD